MNLYEVLRRPLITEKYTMAQAQGKYAFEVAGAANKAEIKQAVEKAFSVHVTNVNVMNAPGKTRRLGRRELPAKPFKKAVVTLKEGDKIEIFQGT
jgi:large subunit ribosomal protein L23